MTDAQPRDAQQRFAEKPYSDPEVSLAETVDGSFLYPPLDWPGGPDQYVHFWKTAPISDEALSNLANSYAERRQEWYEARMFLWADHFDNSREALSFIARNPSAQEIDDWREAKRQEHIAKLEAERPEQIRPAIARFVARAAQMKFNISSRFSDADRKRIEAETVYVNAQDEPWSVDEIWSRYNLQEIMPQGLRDSSAGVRRQLSELRYHLERNT